jgi:alkylated DNA repair dioxygenase AlkB
MYNLRFGVKRGRDEVESASKKLKKEEEQSEGGTTTDNNQLVPVTRPEFLQAYAIKGMENVFYKHNWIPSTLAHQWRRELNELLEWYRPKLKVYGREIQQSRKIAAFSTIEGMKLKYSGHDVEMHSPFPPLVEKIAARLSTKECLGEEVKFNHCMLNMYEDGNIYIGKHSDNVENKVIVTVSLGAERTWIMEEKVKRKKDANGNKEKVQGKKYKWTLGNGSLLVMQGDVQKLYTHEIPKEPKIKQPRISITFRQLIY